MVKQIDASELIVEALSQGQAVRFQVRGDSMAPLILTDDFLIVHPVQRDAMALGDVVLCSSPRGLTAHRVIELRGGSFVTRGDNAVSSDDPLPDDALLGKVTWIEREGRRFEVRSMGGLRLRGARFFARVRRKAASWLS